MKKYFYQIFGLLVALFMPLMSFAQTLPTPPSPEDPESGGIGSPAASPIDMYLVVLGIFALGMILFYGKRFLATTHK